MMGFAAVVAADKPFGTALCTAFARKGWRVYAGEVDPRSTDSVQAAARTLASADDTVDILVVHIDADEVDTSMDALDCELLKHRYDALALGPMRILEAFLPLTRTGLKRLCFVVSGEGIADVTGSDRAGERMAGAALRMSIAITANRLRREGYTFRLFALDRDEADLDTAALAACGHFLSDADDDLRLAVVDRIGRELPL